jgi:uncharacterized protein YvpB
MKFIKGSARIIPILIGTVVLLLATHMYSNAATPSPESDKQSGEEPDSNFNFAFPLIFRPLAPPPPDGVLQKALYCSGSPFNIPDNNSSGITSTISIEDPRYIADLDVRLDIDHTWVGDLFITLRHEETGVSIELLNRIGSPPNSTEKGCRLNNIKAILDDDVSLPVEDECSSYPAAVGVYEYIEAAVAGSYQPDQAFSAFDNGHLNGTWTLTVSDLSPFDTGKVNQWCMAVRPIDAPGFAERPPPPTGLPRNAQIFGVRGQSQALPLDCESRSAVDWADYFGVTINEYDFFYGLPASKNPERGFVGSVYGTWGHLPPNPYGVHAEPIAKRLRQYGLPADSERFLTWNHLKAEIAGGRPVIAWILGSRSSGHYDYVVNGIPEYYYSPDGELSITARFEHTVVVTGYTQDTVTYLNGGSIYQKSLKQFLESWSALGNMAVIYNP